MPGPHCSRFDFHHGPWMNTPGDREVSPRCHSLPHHGHRQFPWSFGHHGHSFGHHGHHGHHKGHHFRPHDYHGHCRPHGHHPHGHGHKHGHHNIGHHHGCGKHPFGPYPYGPWEKRGEGQREFRRNWFWHGTEERRARGCQKKDETVLVRGIVIERGRPNSV